MVYKRWDYRLKKRNNKMQACICALRHVFFCFVLSFQGVSNSFERLARLQGAGKESMRLNPKDFPSSKDTNTH